MRAAGLLERLSASGRPRRRACRACYAWGVTVAPVAWARGSLVVRPGSRPLTAIMAPSEWESWRSGAGVGRARLASLWGFVLASALAWSAAPAALAPLRIDAPRGVAGMIGWALFAFASAAPALQARREAAPRRARRRPRPRQGAGRGRRRIRGSGGLLAAAFQLFGWRVASPERRSSCASSPSPPVSR